MYAAFTKTLLLSLLSAPTGSLPFIEDDPQRAEALATSSGKLVAVDVWATWCHTCLSMKNFILTDPEMKRLADTHVWLALNYDLEKNASFFQTYPVDVFPTFLVIDPKAKKVVSRWAGSGSVEQMLRFFAEAGDQSSDPLQAGRRAMATRNYTEAEKLFAAALAAAEQSGPRRTEILAALIEAAGRNDPARCAEIGDRHLFDTDDSAPGVDFAAMTAGCVAGAGDVQAQKKLWTKIRDRLLRARKRGLGQLSVDDRSTVYDTLTSAHRALGNEKAARTVVAAHLKELEAGARGARSPEARATFDAYRLACYLDLKRYEEAEKMLTASEASLPEDFNPAWRLAVLYHAQGKLELGLAAIERALAKGYGPRRARLHTTKIDLLLKKAAYEDALVAIDAARKDLARLDPTLVRKAWTDQLDAKEREARAKLES